MAEFDLPSHVVSIDGTGWDFEEIGRIGGHHALDNQTFSPDTVLCSNDHLAIGLLTACYERGFKVGRGKNCTIRIAGQDDHPLRALPARR